MICTLCGASCDHSLRTVLGTQVGAVKASKSLSSHRLGRRSGWVPGGAGIMDAGVPCGVQARVFRLACGYSEPPDGGKGSLSKKHGGGRPGGSRARLGGEDTTAIMRTRS